jgi:hypothetical protein
MRVARQFGGAVEHTHLPQRTIGNQATLRYLSQRLSKPPEEAPDQHRPLEAGMLTAGATAGVSRDFSQVLLLPRYQANRLQEPFPFEAPRLPVAIQPKLIVGQADDPLEYEADRVADQVIRMPDPGVSITATPPRVSRKCAACEEEDRTVRKESNGQAQARGEAPSIVRDVLSAPGTSLDAETRAFFEPRFGADFSAVRVSADAHAADSARAVGAQAYAFGSRIVFGAGMYQPSTREGRRLLAHELAHVAQQSAGNAPAAIRRQPPPATPATGPTRTPEDTINAANAGRLAVLRHALTEITTTATPSRATAAAIQKWLHVSPADPTYAATISAVRSLYERNLAMNVAMPYQSNSHQVDPAGNACPPNLAYSRGGVPPIYFCDNFLNKGENCRRDVAIHEYFHLLGLALPPQPENYGAPTTAQALVSPDSLTQLAVEIMDGPHGAYCLGSS